MAGAIQPRPHPRHPRGLRNPDFSFSFRATYTNAPGRLAVYAIIRTRKATCNRCRPLGKLHHRARGRRSIEQKAESQQFLPDGVGK
jgi:hypothetical protein